MMPCRLRHPVQSSTHQQQEPQVQPQLQWRLKQLH